LSLRPWCIGTRRFRQIDCYPLQFANLAALQPPRPRQGEANGGGGSPRLHVAKVLVMPKEAEPDWGAWSRDAVRIMQERNDAWVRDHGLQGCRYDLTLTVILRMVFKRRTDQIAADICVLGSVSESAGTFLWAWANDAIPVHARRGLEKVREFGERNGLELLIKPEWPGGRSEGLEMAAVASRILDASGVWTDTAGDVTLFIALSDFQISE
jgi:hypothetical protein